MIYRAQFSRVHCLTVTVTFPGPSTSSFGEVNKEENFNSLDGGFGEGGIKDDKPHLYTKG